ncbi:MAG: hypothetical protein H0U96_08690 [Acidobacteria bacterium]|nr:hypothetical protein [Acidobacteriota bacterium]
MSGETESTQAKGNQASLITKSLPAPSRPMTCWLSPSSEGKFFFATHNVIE